MAFSGTPVVKKLSDKMFRISGADLTLAGDASGTIGFSDKTSAAEISLAAPQWQPYRLPGPAAQTGIVSLIDAIKVSVNIASDVTTPVPISVVKTGTTHLDFVATLHNDTAATVSPVLEIWVQFHD